MDDTLRSAPSEGQVTDPRVMREVLVTAAAVIPRPGFPLLRYRNVALCLALERALTLMAEPPAALVARCAAVAVLCSWRRRRGADRCLSDLTPALGQTDALGAVLDQAQHLEAQALHGGDGRG
jgi:hypothetical protein